MCGRPSRLDPNAPNLQRRPVSRHGPMRTQPYLRVKASADRARTCGSRGGLRGATNPGSLAGERPHPSGRHRRGRPPRPQRGPLPRPSRLDPDGPRSFPRLHPSRDSGIRTHSYLDVKRSSRTGGNRGGLRGATGPGSLIGGDSLNRRGAAVADAVVRDEDRYRGPQASLWSRSPCPFGGRTSRDSRIQTQPYRRVKPSGRTFDRSP